MLIKIRDDCLQEVGIPRRGMRELSEGDETILHPEWHVGYTGVYICQSHQIIYT